MISANFHALQPEEKIPSPRIPGKNAPLVAGENSATFPP
jgi:hypothetical protein